MGKTGSRFPECSVYSRENAMMLLQYGLKAARRAPRLSKRKRQPTRRRLFGGVCFLSRQRRMRTVTTSSSSPSLCSTAASTPPRRRTSTLCRRVFRNTRTSLRTNRG